MQRKLHLKLTKQRGGCMSIFRKILAVGLMSAAALYAVDVDLTAPVFIDDFDDAYEDAPNQNTISAAYGIIAYGGKPWLGNGYWYSFQDAEGSTVKNADGEQIEAEVNEASMVVDGALHVSLTTSTSANEYPYAGIGCVLAGAGADGEYWDLSKVTAVTLKAKGSGTVRMHFETKDIADMGADWGWYGKVIELTSAWTTVNIPVAQLVPEPYSDPAKADMTWASGKLAVNKLSFQAKNGDDVDLYLDDIQLVGMTYGDFAWTSPVVSSKTMNKSNVFSVSSSAISFNLAKADNVNVTLNNIKGAVVRNLYTGKTASHTISLSNLNLPNGQYLVVVNGQNATYTQRITIAK